jgi:hypothetical protein
MALIECPECTREVSSHASTCPGCGFPVARALREKLDEVTGSDQSKAFRGLAAGHKLDNWAGHYTDNPDEVEAESGNKTLAEKATRITVFSAIVLVVIIQLLWLSSAL